MSPGNTPTYGYNDWQLTNSSYADTTYTDPLSFMKFTHVKFSRQQVREMNRILSSNLSEGAKKHKIDQIRKKNKIKEWSGISEISL